MKFPVAYYLFFIYLSVIIRPFILIGIDVYDHAFEEAIHVATVHAKYGANHLEAAVANTSKEDNKNGTASKSEDMATVHLPAKQEAIIPVADKLSITFPNVIGQKPVSLSLSILAPPPKV